MRQKPKTEMRLSRKDLWRRFLSTGVTSQDIYKKPIRFLRMLCLEKYCWFRLKGVEKRQKKAFDPPNFPGRKQASKITQQYTYAVIYNIGKMTHNVEPQGKRVEPQAQDFRAWSLEDGTTPDLET